MKSAKAAFVLSVAALVSACANDAGVYREPSYDGATENKFLTTNGRATDSLMDRLPPNYTVASLRDAPVLVATIVNLNNLQQSSSLGRSIAELASSRMVARGFNVKELKLRDTVFVREGTGELLLSRELKDIARSHSAPMVLVGTYSVAADVVFLNLKIVRTDDSRILSAIDYALPTDRTVSALLLK